MKNLYNIKGVKSIFLPQIHNWQYLECLFFKLMRLYSYNEIKLQLLEKTILLRQTLGETSDVIRKEMYTFHDKNEESITLLPEGTTSCLKSLLGHGFLRNANKQNVWYYSPMFRREKPQSGRQRMFYQIGVESYGFNDLVKELEHVIIFNRLLCELNINTVLLEVNFLPNNSKVSTVYQAKLNKFLSNNLMNSIDSKINPLNFLDKNKSIYKVDIPKSIDYFNDKFSMLKFMYLLKKLNINYIFNCYLVRGLSYYNNIVYEWTALIKKRRLAICAGGRYDDLSIKISNVKSFSTGFAFGVERLLYLLKKIKRRRVCFLIFTDYSNDHYLNYRLLEDIRSILKGKCLLYEYKKKHLKKVLKKNVFLKVLKLYKYKKNVLLY